MTTTAHEFRRCYVRAMALAALAFAIAHGSQLFIRGLISQRSFAIAPTGFLALIPYVLLEAIVFFTVGSMVAYLPSRAGYIFFLRIDKNDLFYSILFGFLVGLIFLPLCAGFVFSLFRAADLPSYLARCAEFGVPMTIAGAIGGYVFWRSARGTAMDRQLITSLFS